MLGSSNSNVLIIARHALHVLIKLACMHACMLGPGTGLLQELQLDESASGVMGENGVTLAQPATV